jgi:hypothetical protein
VARLKSRTVLLFNQPHFPISASPRRNRADGKAGRKSNGAYRLVGDDRQESRSPDTRQGKNRERRHAASQTGPTPPGSP